MGPCQFSGEQLNHPSHSLSQCYPYTGGGLGFNVVFDVSTPLKKETYHDSAYRSFVKTVQRGLQQSYMQKKIALHAQYGLCSFRRFLFVTMAAASLLLLPIESKQNLTVYVGMMASKCAMLQGGECVQPMANSARWGLKATVTSTGAGALAMHGHETS